MPVTPQEEKWILFWRISFRICREDARVQRCFRRFWVYYCFVRFGICLISLAHHFCLLFPVSAACRCPFKLCIVSVWVALLIKSSLNTQKKKRRKRLPSTLFYKVFLAIGLDASLLESFLWTFLEHTGHLTCMLELKTPISHLLGTHRTSYMHVGAKKPISLTTFPNPPPT
jgi:hypothetical protein